MYNNDSNSLDRITPDQNHTSHLNSRNMAGTKRAHSEGTTGTQWKHNRDPVETQRRCNGDSGDTAHVHEYTWICINLTSTFFVLQDLKLTYYTMYLHLLWIQVNTLFILCILPVVHIYICVCTNYSFIFFVKSKVSELFELMSWVTCNKILNKQKLK